MAVFDDGSGRALYCGGQFYTAGGAPARHIARWNGTTWSGVGGGLNDIVSAFAVFDDGTGRALYAGGRFTRAGETLVHKVAKWDGTTWSALGPAFSPNGGGVEAMAVYDDGAGPALYVGGPFSTSLGSTQANRIAMWNGAEWSSVGEGLGNSTCSVDFCYPSALTTFDDGSGLALYAGGRFSTAGGQSVMNIARWNGSNWSPVGAGISGAVFALQVLDDGRGPGLFAGGGFTGSGTTTAHNVARWDGQSWTPLGSGTGGSVNPTVWALGAFDDGGARPENLFAGGLFSTAGGHDSYGIAEWYACPNVGTLQCAGDGSIAACPCANSGGTGRGCRNSGVAAGALLYAQGKTNPDTIVLQASGEPAAALSVFLQGDATLAPPIAFGDGLLCARGNLLRLYVADSGSGSLSAPGAGEPSITQRSARLGDVIAPGSLRNYQVYYRDASLAFCPSGDAWNVTNAVAIEW
jgi:hypothetical protein